jgi:hypothetical protein
MAKCGRRFCKLKGAGEEGTGALVGVFSNLFVLRLHQTIFPSEAQRRDGDNRVTIPRLAGHWPECDSLGNA